MACYTIREITKICLQKELFHHHSAWQKIGETQYSPTIIMKSSFRSFRKSKDITPQYSGLQHEAINPGYEPLIVSRLTKPLLFTLGFSSFSMIGASIWQYENARSKAQSLFQSSKSFWDRRFEKKGKFRQDLNKWWRSRSEGDKMFIPICGLNCLVFILWKVPRFQPAMAKYFLSTPSRKNLCWPMFLSTFSHFSILHLAANMFVLQSFSNVVVSILGKEQFLGLYVSAGVISSFFSYSYKILSKQPGFSLGASGAIMTLVSLACFVDPTQQLYIILLPFFTFQASLAIRAIMAFDAAGLIFGWKFFDHAAHLGGALTGIAWYKWGNQYVWQNREPVLEVWHSIRGAVRK